MAFKYLRAPTTKVVQNRQKGDFRGGPLFGHLGGPLFGSKRGPPGVRGLGPLLGHLFGALRSGLARIGSLRPSSHGQTPSGGLQKVPKKCHFGHFWDPFLTPPGWGPDWLEGRRDPFWARWPKSAQKGCPKMIIQDPQSTVP